MPVLANTLESSVKRFLALCDSGPMCLEKRNVGPVESIPFDLQLHASSNRGTIVLESDSLKHHGKGGLYGSSPYTINWLWEPTKTFPFATRGMLNFVATPSVSREPAWLVL